MCKYDLQTLYTYQEKCQSLRSILYPLVGEDILDYVSRRILWQTMHVEVFYSLLLENACLILFQIFQSIFHYSRLLTSYNTEKNHFDHTVLLSGPHCFSQNNLGHDYSARGTIS